jgi:hypothetical protein
MGRYMKNWRHFLMTYNIRKASQQLFGLPRLKIRAMKAVLPCTVLIVLLLSTLTFGQTLISGDIDGIVTDPSGAVITNATVVATEIDTGTVTTAKTTRDGVYHLPLLKPGPYTVTLSSAGFNTATVNVLVGLACIIHEGAAIAVLG